MTTEEFLSKTIGGAVYLGSVEFSPEDDCWHGHILNTTDLITYEADTLELLPEQFCRAVKDWIETGKELSGEVMP